MTSQLYFELCSYFVLLSIHLSVNFSATFYKRVYESSQWNCDVYFTSSFIIYDNNCNPKRHYG